MEDVQRDCCMALAMNDESGEGSSFTIFRLLLALIFLLVFQRLDSGQADDVAHGVADAFDGDEQGDTRSQPQPSIIYAVCHVLNVSM